MPSFFDRTSPVVRLQLACDGKWEESLHLTRDTADEFVVERWLEAASSNIAVEAFIAVENGLAFIGVRIAALPRERQHEIVRGLVSRFNGQPAMSAGLFVDTMESLAGCALFRTAPVFLELGKVNAWRSFGSVVFWPHPDGQAPIESFSSALAAHPKFFEPSALPFAVEFAFEEHLPHWYGQPVSAAAEGGYQIDSVAAEQILGASLGIASGREDAVSPGCSI